MNTENIFPEDDFVGIILRNGPRRYITATLKDANAIGVRVLNWLHNRPDLYPIFIPWTSIEVMFSANAEHIDDDYERDDYYCGLELVTENWAKGKTIEEIDDSLSEAFEEPDEETTEEQSPTSL